MRPDRTRNLQEYPIKQGVSAITLLAFLVTYLVWPVPVSAKDALRQEPIPEAAGLEELREKLRGKQPLVSTAAPVPIAAGMEEMRGPLKVEQLPHEIAEYLKGLLPTASSLGIPSHVPLSLNITFASPSRRQPWIFHLHEADLETWVNQLEELFQGQLNVRKEVAGLWYWKVTGEADKSISTRVSEEAPLKEILEDWAEKGWMMDSVTLSPSIELMPVLSTGATQEALQEAADKFFGVEFNQLLEHFSEHQPMSFRLYQRLPGLVQSLREQEPPGVWPKDALVLRAERLQSDPNESLIEAFKTTVKRLWPSQMFEDHVYDLIVRPQPVTSSELSPIEVPHGEKVHFEIVAYRRAEAEPGGMEETGGEPSSATGLEEFQEKLFGLVKIVLEVLEKYPGQGTPPEAFHPYRQEIEKLGISYEDFYSLITTDVYEDASRILPLLPQSAESEPETLEGLVGAFTKVNLGMFTAVAEALWNALGTGRSLTIENLTRESLSLMQSYQKGTWLESSLVSGQTGADKMLEVIVQKTRDLFGLSAAGLEETRVSRRTALRWIGGILGAGAMTPLGLVGGKPAGRYVADWILGRPPRFPEGPESELADDIPIPSTHLSILSRPIVTSAGPPNSVQRMRTIKPVKPEEPPDLVFVTVQPKEGTVQTTIELPLTLPNTKPPHAPSSREYDYFGVSLDGSENVVGIQAQLVNTTGERQPLEMERIIPAPLPGESQKVAGWYATLPGRPPWSSQELHWSQWEQFGSMERLTLVVTHSDDKPFEITLSPLIIVRTGKYAEHQSKLQLGGQIGLATATALAAAAGVVGGAIIGDGIGKTMEPAHLTKSDPNSAAGLEETGSAKRWYEVRVEKGIPVDKVVQHLHAIRGGLAWINQELDQDRQIHEKNITKSLIRQYGRAVGRLNKVILNGPMTAATLEREFLRFHRVLGGEDLIRSAGRYDEEKRDEMRRLFRYLISDESKEDMARDPVGVAAHLFVKLVSLQGFSDGNKRAASLIMNYVLLKVGFSPFLLTEENVVEYTKLVNPLREGDERKFSEFLKSQVHPAAGLEEILSLRDGVMKAGGTTYLVLEDRAPSLPTAEEPKTTYLFSQIVVSPVILPAGVKQIPLSKSPSPTPDDQWKLELVSPTDLIVLDAGTVTSQQVTEWDPKTTGVEPYAIVRISGEAFQTIASAAGGLEALIRAAGLEESRRLTVEKAAFLEYNGRRILALAT